MDRPRLSVYPRAVRNAARLALPPDSLGQDYRELASRAIAMATHQMGELESVVKHRPLSYPELRRLEQIARTLKLLRPVMTRMARELEPSAQEPVPSWAKAVGG